jgi:hypothetical protein
VGAGHWQERQRPEDLRRGPDCSGHQEEEGPVPGTGKLSYNETILSLCTAQPQVAESNWLRDPCAIYGVFNMRLTSKT